MKETSVKIHQRSLAGLEQACDAIIAAWVRSLDLRDREPEGHTERLAQISVQIARMMGLGETDGLHMRRGALLHDIGKLGIPDGILMKPGTLTEPEWAIMRQHPIIAQELLSPVEFLRQALDIPYCHHEKWDGSGYPRGLAGEQIPLPARIFAVIDVYVMLNSDRPYRPAWPRENALAYIRDQTGKHFDPRVVEFFLLYLETREGIKLAENEPDPGQGKNTNPYRRF